MFPYRPLAKPFLAGSVCLLIIAQTTCALLCITRLDMPAVANRAPGFARHVVEEVGGSSAVADAGVFAASLSPDAQVQKEGHPERLVRSELESGILWPSELRFHRRIPPLSGDEDS